MNLVKHLGYYFAMDEDLSFSVVEDGGKYYARIWSMVTEWKEGPFLTPEEAEKAAREYGKKVYKVYL